MLRLIVKLAREGSLPKGIGDQGIGSVGVLSVEGGPERARCRKALVTRSTARHRSDTLTAREGSLPKGIGDLPSGKVPVTGGFSGPRGLVAERHW